jgi:hypothetical protein
MSYVRKIINDPVYGFITVDHPLISKSFHIHITSACAAFTRWLLPHWFTPVLYIHACITHWAPTT